MRDVFVVAGDAEHPVGEFTGAAGLLAALDEIGHPFADIGITGYPESHPLIDDETAIAADVREVAVRHLHREPDLLRSRA